MAVGPVLAQPGGARAGAQEIGFPAESVGKQVLGGVASGGRHRVEDGDGEHADEEGDHDPRTQELPYRHAAGAHDGELALATELQKGRDRADEHGESDQELGIRRQPQNGDQRQGGQRHLALLARLAEQLDEIDQVDQHCAEQEGRQNRHQEAGGDVAAEGAGSEHCRYLLPPVAGRPAGPLRRRPASQAKASTMGSKRMPGKRDLLSRRRARSISRSAPSMPDSGSA